MHLNTKNLASVNFVTCMLSEFSHYPIRFFTLIYIGTRCPYLLSPSYGSVIVAGYTVGNSATYSCNSGCTRSGVSIRFCLSSGTWSGSAPTCQCMIIIIIPSKYPIIVMQCCGIILMHAYLHGRLFSDY